MSPGKLASYKGFDAIKISSPIAKPGTAPPAVSSPSKVSLHLPVLPNGLSTSSILNTLILKLNLAAAVGFKGLGTLLGFVKLVTISPTLGIPPIEGSVISTSLPC